jgi:hypothetical protein
MPSKKSSTRTEAGCPIRLRERRRFPLNRKRQAEGVGDERIFDVRVALVRNPIFWARLVGNGVVTKPEASAVPAHTAKAPSDQSACGASCRPGPALPKSDYAQARRASRGPA